MNTPVQLSPERGYADGAQYSPYDFPARSTMSALSGNTFLVSSHTLGGSSGADRDHAARMYKTI